MIIEAHAVASAVFVSIALGATIAATHSQRPNGEDTEEIARRLEEIALERRAFLKKSRKWFRRNPAA